MTLDDGNMLKSWFATGGWLQKLDSAANGRGRAEVLFQIVHNPIGLLSNETVAYLTTRYTAYSPKWAVISTSATA